MENAELPPDPFGHRAAIPGHQGQLRHPRRTQLRKPGGRAWPRAVCHRDAADQLLATPDPGDGLGRGLQPLRPGRIDPRPHPLQHALVSGPDRPLFVDPGDALTGMGHDIPDGGGGKPLGLCPAPDRGGDRMLGLRLQTREQRQHAPLGDL